MRPALVLADLSLSLAAVNWRSFYLAEIGRLKIIIPAVTAWRRDRFSSLTNSTLSIFVWLFSPARTGVGARAGEAFNSARKYVIHRSPSHAICIH